MLSDTGSWMLSNRSAFRAFRVIEHSSNAPGSLHSNIARMLCRAIVYLATATRPQRGTFMLSGFADRIFIRVHGRGVRMRELSMKH